MKLRDKTILIVGASAGIGRSVAERLARDGNRLIITARRKTELMEVAESVLALGSPCLPLASDALEEAACVAVVARGAEAFGRIDAALLNVGQGPPLHMGKVSAAEVKHMMSVNYDVMVNFLVPLIAHMRVSGSGLIAHTNSLAEFLGVPMQGPYSAAKSAGRILLDACRTELKRTGVRFITVSPGFIATERTANDGIPAPFEISSSACAEYIVRAMEAETWDARFPWQTSMMTRFLQVLPKRIAGNLMLRFVPDDYG